MNTLLRLYNTLAVCLIVLLATSAAAQMMVLSGGRGAPPAEEESEVPDATNTGIAGVGVTEGMLTTTSLSTGRTTSDGQVIDLALINRDVCVLHNNVTIKRSKINGEIWVGRRNPCTGSGDVTVTGTIIEDTTIDPSGGLEGIIDLGGIDSIYRRNNICCAQNFFTAWDNALGSVSTDVQFINNYGHDEESSAGDPHFDGIEAYCWSGLLTISNNAIYQTESSGATAPLNITPVSCSESGSASFLAENNIFQSANSAYTVLLDCNQGGTVNDMVFNNNRLWRTTSGGWFDTSHGCPGSEISGTGNVDHITGNAVSTP